jgi:DNA repair protein RecO
MEKINKGIVLRYTHFGETSAILNVLTQNQGISSVLLHGVKKHGGNYGVGALIEWQVSRKYSGVGGLPKSSKYDILDNYSFGGNIEKIALRDCSFELILQVIPQEIGETPELFNLLEKYLKYLEKTDSDMFFGFWLFCIRFAGFLGYEIDLRHCKRCGAKIVVGKQKFLYLSNQSGGFLCGDCRSKPNFNSEILQILSKGGANIGQKLKEFSQKEKIFITEQLISYIQFHSGKDYKLNSFKFFCDCISFI